MNTKDSTYHIMPFLLGPFSKQYNPAYNEVEVVVFQYLTEPEVGLKPTQSRHCRFRF